MKWVRHGGVGHAVLGEDAGTVLTKCGMELHGYDASANLDDFEAPPGACDQCWMLLAMDLVVPEPIEDAIARGYEPFDSTQSE